jgi:hypothetical protein
MEKQNNGINITFLKKLSEAFWLGSRLLAGQNAESAGSPLRWRAGLPVL